MSWITDCALFEGVIITPPAPGITGVVAHWDASEASTTTTFIEDLIGSSDLTGTSMNMSTLNGLDIMMSGGSGRMQTSTSPLSGGAQPFGLTLVAKNAGASHTYFNHGSSAGARPHAVTNAGLNRMNAGTNLDDGVADISWHVYYFEWNDTSSKVYIDGVLETTGAAGTGAPVGNVVTFLNNEGGGNDSTPLTLWAEAKLSTGVQNPTDVLGEATNLLLKWQPYGVNAICTGGTITVDTPTLVEHTFTQSGKLRLPNGGSLPIDYLVVAGGGGGACGLAGGGGAGGYQAGSTTLSASHAVTIGAGGAGGAAGGLNDGVAGSNTVFGSIATATGGGKGGHGSTATTNGGNGGSGGGGGANNTGAGGTGGTGSQGSNGGTGESSGSGPPWAAGGGGGAGGTGGNGAGSTGGAGGAGTAWNGTTYAGGGGGGATSGGTGGTGGAGGAGGGGAGGGGGVGAATQGTNGTANTGSGGGGSGDVTGKGGDGGSGIVKVRYDPTAYSP